MQLNEWHEAASVNTRRQRGHETALNGSDWRIRYHATTGIWLAMERRRHTRHFVETGAWLCPPHERQPVPVRSADLSVSGVRLHCMKPIAPGTPLLIRLQLSATGPALECKGRVCWCAPLSNDAYQFGVRFLDVTDDEFEEVEGHLRSTRARPVLAAV